MWKRTINQGSLGSLCGFLETSKHPISNITTPGKDLVPLQNQLKPWRKWVEASQHASSEVFSESADWTAVKEKTIYKHPKIQLLILQMFDPTWNFLKSLASPGSTTWIGPLTSSKGFKEKWWVGEFAAWNNNISTIYPCRIFHIYIKSE